MEDILDAIARIERYTVNLSFDDFSADDRTIDPVLRNLEVIGEAARLIPDDIVEMHSQVPWEAMRGMRKVLAHEYFGVDLGIIWKTIQDDIPLLVDPLKRILGD